MSRYIEENEVYKLLEPNGVARVHCSQIDDLPRADVVEVVRCERCDHSTIICNTADGSKHWHCTKGYGLPEVDATDFCSHGERKEENEG